ncbi:MAG: hypothetical protein GY733_06315, partial [bacterium]|nr:hypothetical protein [bacterium]
MHEIVMRQVEKEPIPLASDTLETLDFWPCPDNRSVVYNRSNGRALSSMKILVASSVFPSALAELRRDHDVVVAVDAPRERLLELIEDREALVFRSGVTISAEVMSRAPDLRLLIRAGSGLDNLDLEYATRNRIELVRVPEPGARAVAELAFGFMLALARQMLFADLELRAGHWAKHRITGHLLADKTLGIYGAGNIGSLVGAMGAAWGMKVIGCVDRASPSRAAELASSNIRLATCEEVLTESDFVSIHLPLDASTRGLFDA